MGVCVGLRSRLPNARLVTDIREPSGGGIESIGLTPHQLFGGRTIFRWGLDDFEIHSLHLAQLFMNVGDARIRSH